VFSSQEARGRPHGSDVIETAAQRAADLAARFTDRSKNGRPRHSIERLYRDTAPLLRRFFRSRVRDYDDADDMVQEVFVRLARDDNVECLRNASAWLQRVARNLVLDRARSAEIRNMAKRVSLDEADLPAIQPDQMLGLEAADMRYRYEVALNALSERTREVFLLHRIEELSYREIANTLGISVSTVEYHMMRALAHFDRSLPDR
jgi:RNA polymerase sigma factor (sigma-70 family)